LLIVAAYPSDDIAGHLRHMNAATPLLFDEVIVFTAEIETAVIDVALQWTLGPYEKIHSFVNGIATTGGGMHVEGFKKGLTGAVKGAAQKPLRETSTPVVELLGEDIREGLTAIIWADVDAPLFEGWMHSKLANLEVRPAVERTTHHFLGEWFEENPFLARRVVDKSTAAADLRAAAREEWEKRRRGDRP
jgi:DNA gyrase subunit B